MSRRKHLAEAGAGAALLLCLVGAVVCGIRLTEADCYFETDWRAWEIAWARECSITMHGDEEPGYIHLTGRRYAAGPLILFRPTRLLMGEDLTGAHLAGADFWGADLRDAVLRRADMRHADLRRADLYGADLRGADLRGADLRSTMLKSADLTGAFYDEDTGWPAGCDSRAHGAVPVR